MTAAAAEQYRIHSIVDRRNAIEFRTQAANTTLWKGAVIVKVAGKAQPVQTAVAGQLLLGVSLFTYGPVTVDTTWNNPPMVFEEGCWEIPNSTTDPVVAADIGSTVAFADDSTVKHTNAANDVLVVCKYITPRGTVGVEIVRPSGS